MKLNWKHIFINWYPLVSSTRDRRQIWVRNVSQRLVCLNMWTLKWLWQLWSLFGGKAFLKEELHWWWTLTLDGFTLVPVHHLPCWFCYCVCCLFVKTAASTVWLIRESYIIMFCKQNLCLTLQKFHLLMINILPTTCFWIFKVNKIVLWIGRIF